MTRTEYSIRKEMAALRDELDEVSANEFERECRIRREIENCKRTLRAMRRDRRYRGEDV